MGSMQRLWAALGRHDPGYAALRRAVRAAIVMPGSFALCLHVIHNPVMAPFAAFGAIATLLLVDFRGSRFDRLRSQAALIVLDAVLVAIGTLCSRSTVLAVVAMAVLGFLIIFAGVVSSTLAGATDAAAARLHPAGDPARDRGRDPGPGGRLGAGRRVLDARDLAAVADSRGRSAAPARDRGRSRAGGSAAHPRRSRGDRRRPRRRPRGGADGAGRALAHVSGYAVSPDQSDHGGARRGAPRRRAAVARRRGAGERRWWCRHRCRRRR